jgi:hypothetical protein
MEYRRGNVKGGTYLFTVNLVERHFRLLVDGSARRVRSPIARQEPERESGNQ